MRETWGNPDYPSHIQQNAYSNRFSFTSFCPASAE